LVAVVPILADLERNSPRPSGLRAPPKSEAGWLPTQMKKLEVAVSGPLRAMETVPSLGLAQK
jgi:hypothetical protein